MHITPAHKIAVETYLLPAHWASALINGDYSGCEDAEETEINEWLAANPQLGGCYSCSDEPEFRTRNDAGTLAGDCLEFTFPVITEQAT